MARPPIEVPHRDRTWSRFTLRESITLGYVDGDPAKTCPHSFESDRHYTSFLEQAANGHVSLKFAFSGSAAETHDELAKSAGYQTNTKNVLAEMNVITGLGLGAAQICDIGPGNGQHTAELLGLVRSVGLRVERYLGLDFSEKLVDIAIPRISLANPDVSITRGQWDLEDDKTKAIEEWRTEALPVVAMLLGITLGNVLDVNTCLAHLRDSLRAGDLVLFEVALAPLEGLGEAALSAYREPVFQRAVLEPFRMAGLAQSDLELEVSIEDDSIVCNVRLLGPLVNQLNMHPVCDAGTRIRCFISRRFRLDVIAGILNDQRFLACSNPVQDDGGHALLMTKVGR